MEQVNVLRELLRLIDHVNNLPIEDRLALCTSLSNAGAALRDVGSLSELEAHVLFDFANYCGEGA